MDAGGRLARCRAPACVEAVPRDPAPLLCHVLSGRRLNSPRRRAWCVASTPYRVAISEDTRGAACRGDADLGPHPVHGASPARPRRHWQALPFRCISAVNVWNSLLHTRKCHPAAPTEGPHPARMRRALRGLLCPLLSNQPAPGGPTGSQALSRPGVHCPRWTEPVSPAPVQVWHGATLSASMSGHKGSISKSILQAKGGHSSCRRRKRFRL